MQPHCGSSRGCGQLGLHGGAAQAWQLLPRTGAPAVLPAFFLMGGRASTVLDVSSRLSFRTNLRSCKCIQENQWRRALKHLYLGSWSPRCLLGSDPRDEVLGSSAGGARAQCSAKAQCPGWTSGWMGICMRAEPHGAEWQSRLPAGSHTRMSPQGLHTALAVIAHCSTETASEARLQASPRWTAEARGRGAAGQHTRCGKLS